MTRRACCWVLLSAFGLTASPAMSATLTVCGVGCDHTTIQDAVDAAVAGDTVQLLNTTYSEWGISIDKSLTILGLDGIDQMPPSVVDGQFSGRVFTVEVGATVVLRGLQIQNGTDLLGGGIQVQAGAELRLVDVYLFFNGGSVGGGVFNQGALTVERVWLYGNDADEGGGIYSSESGTLSIRDSILSFNTGKKGGGLAIYGQARIEGSQLSDNKGLRTVNDGVADAGTGGGAWVCSSDPVDFVNSTLVSNWAWESGGGIAVCPGSSVGLANVTIVDNIADYDQNSAGDGGGLFGDFDMGSSIVSGNTDASIVGIGQTTAPDCSGGITSRGYNIIGSRGFDLAGVGFFACQITGDTTGNKLAVDPLLGSLNDNGGFSKTLGLTASSPAIDQGDPAGCTDADGTPLAVDQRGAPRVGRCDIGAYERLGCPELVLEELTVVGFEPHERCSIVAGPLSVLGPSGSLILEFGDRVVLRSGFSVEHGASLVVRRDPALTMGAATGVEADRARHGAGRELRRAIEAISARSRVERSKVGASG